MLCVLQGKKQVTAGWTDGAMAGTKAFVSISGIASSAIVQKVREPGQDERDPGEGAEIERLPGEDKSRTQSDPGSLWMRDPSCVARQPPFSGARIEIFWLQ